MTLQQLYNAIKALSDPYIAFSKVAEITNRRLIRLENGIKWVIVACDANITLTDTTQVYYISQTTDNISLNTLQIALDQLTA